MTNQLLKNNLKFLFLLTFSLAINSCFSLGKVDDKLAIKFNNINVDQVDNQGSKQYTFKSKKARIGENSKLAIADESELTIYQNNKPQYLVVSDKARLVNNGEQVILEDNIVIKSILNDSLEVFTDKLTWYQKQSIAILEGNIKSKVNDTFFLADSATYNHFDNTIEFAGLRNFIHINKNIQTDIYVVSDSALWDGSKRKLLFFSEKNQVKSDFVIYSENN